MVQRVVLVFAFFLTACSQYIVDDSKLGREFDGIGGLSGGGVRNLLLCIISVSHDVLLFPGYLQTASNLQTGIPR